MRKKYWMILSSVLLLAPLSLLAEDMLVPWAPAVIDSDEQAKAENRARLQAIESMHSPAENSAEAWMKKFSPNVSAEDEEALAEEKTTSGTVPKAASRAIASPRSGAAKGTAAHTPSTPSDSKQKRSAFPEATPSFRGSGTH